MSRLYMLPDWLGQTGPQTDLSELARHYARASISENTRRSYASQIKQWQAYADTLSCAFLPSNPIAVANWLAVRADEGRAYATIRTGLAAVRAANVAAGHAFDTRHPAIDTVLRGIARQIARPQRQALPKRGTDVLSILDRLTPAPRDLRDGALFSLGYMFAARRSELSGLDFAMLGDGDGFIVIGSAAFR